MIETILGFLGTNIFGMIAGSGVTALAFLFGFAVKILLDINKTKKIPEKFTNDNTYKGASFVRKHGPLTSVGQGL